MSGEREGPARTASAGRGAGGRGRGSAPRVALGSVMASRYASVSRLPAAAARQVGARKGTATLRPRQRSS
jgi:hypothetical protein